MKGAASYLLAQARRRPAAAAQFAAVEIWRRARMRFAVSAPNGLPSFAQADPRERFRHFLPVGALNADAFRAAFPEAVDSAIAAADRICNHEFEIFGRRVSLGAEIDWHRDWLTGHQWPMERTAQHSLPHGPAGADVKRPWEVARFHHALALGKAYRLTRESRYAAGFAAQVQSWMAANPAGRGIHWAMPMECAIRSINWCAAAALFADAPELGADFWHALLRSLYAHGRQIHAHREWNPVARGNHYLSCVAGLLHLGVLFAETQQGGRWLADARVALPREMHEQVGDDGVAKEGSTGYHCFVAELMLTSALLVARYDAATRETNGAPPSLRTLLAESWGAEFTARLEKMFNLPAAMLAGRERAPIWGDTDDGRVLPFCGAIADPASHLLRAAAVVFERDDWPVASHRCEDAWWLTGRAARVVPIRESSAPAATAFPGAGFFFFASSRLRGSVRCGPLGVNGWANHAHCDQLSVEFCCDGRPLLVDPGNYAYSGDAAARDEFRSSRYHNSVVVNGAEQSRFWPDLMFRMMDDTRSRLLQWNADNEQIEFAGEHYGYTRLPERVTVRRRALLDRRRDALVITDSLAGRGQAQLEWNFHFAPAVTVERISSYDAPPAAEKSGAARLALYKVDEMTLAIYGGESVLRSRVTLQEGWVAPRFGQRVKAPVLHVECHADLPAEVTVEFSLA